MDNGKTIEALRKFFSVSIIVFETQNKFAKVFGVEPKINDMHKLHLEAKTEIEKENPDMEYMDFLLEKMENLAEETNIKNQNK